MTTGTRAALTLDAPEGARAMIALEVPGDAAATLASLAADLDGVEPIPASDLHVTLCYLGRVGGDVTADQLAAAPALVERATVWADPVEVRVTGLARFRTGSDGGDAIVALVRSDGAAFLRGDVVERLAHAGLGSASTHPWTPHVTLARLPADAPTPALPDDALDVAWVNEDIAVIASEPDDEQGGAEHARVLVPIGHPAERQPIPAAVEGELVAMDSARRLVGGPVLVPGEPDRSGSTLTAEKVEELAHGYLASWRAIDADHDLRPRDAAPVESYLLDSPRTVRMGGRRVELPAGTWWMTVHVADDDAWRDVERGRLRGFSILGAPRDEVEQPAAAQSDDGFPFRRVTVDELDAMTDGDWIVPMVSLVERPNVPKAEFVTVQSAESWRERLSRALRGDRPEEQSLAANAGRRISDARMERLEAARAQLAEGLDAIDAVLDEGRQERAAAAASGDPTPDREDSDMDTQQVTEAVSEAVAQGVAPLQDRLGAVEQHLGLAPNSDADTDANDADDADGPDGDETPAAAQSDAGTLVEQVRTVVEQSVAPLRDRLDEVEAAAQRAGVRVNGGSLNPDDAAAQGSRSRDLGRDALGRRRRQRS